MMAKTKQKRKINVTIRSTASVVKEILDTCRAAEKGKLVPEAERELTFNDAATMLSTLSEKRMELLMFLHNKKPITIKDLSRQLQRNYSNVHEDVQLLLRLGLLETDKDKRIFVPWDELNISLSLAA